MQVSCYMHVDNRIAESLFVFMTSKLCSRRDTQEERVPELSGNVRTSVFGILSWTQVWCHATSDVLFFAGPQEDGSENYDSFKTFGKSRVSDVGRDGSITYTFEEDDDVDAQSLSSQLLGGS